jgi:hypothetical protein
VVVLAEPAVAAAVARQIESEPVIQVTLEILATRVIPEIQVSLPWIVAQAIKPRQSFYSF